MNSGTQARIGGAGPSADGLPSRAAGAAGPYKIGRLPHVHSIVRSQSIRRE